MAQCESCVEVEPQSISVWKEPWAKRPCRVTLLLDLDEQIAVVADDLHRFWFLPGGAVERGESLDEAAKREAEEELGLEVSVNRILKTYRITLVSKETKERLRIPSFVLVHATSIGGQLKTEYASDRKILRVKKDQCNSFLRNFEIPIEYDWMRPYFYVSRRAVQEFLK